MVERWGIRRQDIYLYVLTRKDRSYRSYCSLDLKAKHTSTQYVSACTSILNLDNDEIQVHST